jgi:hypothetical protein
MLNKMGIEAVNVKRAITGGILLEVAGEKSSDFKDSEDITNKLLNKLRAAFDGMDVKVNRPVKRVDIRIYGFDESVGIKDITESLAKISGWHSDNFRCGNTKFFRGLGSAIVSCPVDATLKIMEANKIGKIVIGWALVKINLLKNRPMTCFRCSGLGHPA